MMVFWTGGCDCFSQRGDIVLEQWNSIRFERALYCAASLSRAGTFAISTLYLFVAPLSVEGVSMSAAVSSVA